MDISRELQTITLLPPTRSHQNSFLHFAVCCTGETRLVKTKSMSAVHSMRISSALGDFKMNINIGIPITIKLSNLTKNENIGSGTRIQRNSTGA